MAAPKCLCCGDELDVVRTKTNKPYVRCDACGFQGFVRGNKGIARFEAKYGAGWRDEPVRAVPVEPATPPAKKPEAKAAAATKSAGKKGGDIMEFEEEGDDD